MDLRAHPGLLPGDQLLTDSCEAVDETPLASTASIGVCEISEGTPTSRQPGRRAPRALRVGTSSLEKEGDLG